MNTNATAADIANGLQAGKLTIFHTYVDGAATGKEHEDGPFGQHVKIYYRYTNASKATGRGSSPVLVTWDKKEEQISILIALISAKRLPKRRKTTKKLKPPSRWP